MKKTEKDYDVIVAGAGNAAFCAALAAREKGASVLMLERAPREENGGNSRFTAGAIRFAYDGVDHIPAFAAPWPGSHFPCFALHSVTNRWALKMSAGVMRGARASRLLPAIARSHSSPVCNVAMLYHI